MLYTLKIGLLGKLWIPVSFFITNKLDKFMGGLSILKQKPVLFWFFFKVT